MLAYTHVKIDYDDKEKLWSLYTASKVMLKSSHVLKNKTKLELWPNIFSV